ncbi:MAG: SoxR reducing system RseC family protein [Thermodesulfobacteriota bacterium]|nr:SoxR reducing system RseC family protein [Thermodesulfobacteriota bacterium]
MTVEKTIEHQGIIKEIINGVIQVSISQVSACSACHAKGVCRAGDTTDKLVDVICQDNSYKIGDTVNIVLAESLGFKALFLSYLLPFLILISSLIITTILTNNEFIAGLTSITIIIPYYFILYLNRDKIKKKFIFKLK